MLYGDIIDVRRRDAVTAGDTHLVTLSDLVLANGVDGDPLAADDARTQALLELGRRFPDSHTTTRPCSRARATSTTCSGSRSGRRRNKSPSRAPPASRAPKRAPEGLTARQRQGGFGPSTPCRLIGVGDRPAVRSGSTDPDPIHFCTRRSNPSGNTSRRRRYALRNSVYASAIPFARAVATAASNLSIVALAVSRAATAASSAVLAACRRLRRASRQRVACARQCATSRCCAPINSVRETLYSHGLRVTNRNDPGGTRSTMPPPLRSARAPRRRGSTGKPSHRCCRDRRASRARCPRRFVGSGTPSRTRAT